MGLAEIPVPSLLNKNWIRDTDWLASRLDKWISRCQGYNKLKNCNQSLSDDAEDDSNWDGPSSCEKKHKNQRHFLFKNSQYCAIEHSNHQCCHQDNCDASEEPSESPKQHSLRRQPKTTRCCQNIKCEMTVDNYPNFQENLEVNDNYEAHTPLSRTEIRIAVNNKVITSVELDNQNDQNGNHDNDTSAVSKYHRATYECECCNGDPIQDNRGGLDKHRKLIQIMATPIRKLGKQVASEDKFTKDYQHPISEVAAWRQASNELRSFLSFRRRNTSKATNRKRRVVVGGVGANDPVWPSVLLTFERGVSNRPDSPHSLLTYQENKQRS